MAGQVNIYKGSTFLPPPTGYRGYGFDPLGNPVIIKEDGTYEELKISGSSSNVTANAGVGLLADLPAGHTLYDVYVTTDTLSVYTYDGSAWTIADLEDKQFVTDSSSSVKVLYQLINSVLYNLTVISIDALDVNFNPVTGITATNVQGAIEEAYAAGGGGGGAVDSVNGQTGAVVLNADDIDDSITTNKFTTQTEADKLVGIEAGAEVNNISDIQASDLTNGGNSPLHYHDTDRNRTNHTGTQTASTISDFDTEADARITLQKGAINGIAELDALGLVPVSQLPDIGSDNVLEYADLSSFPAIGEANVIYIAIDTALIYRWTGSAYAELSAGGGGGAVDSVNGQTGVVLLDADDIDDTSTTNKFTTQAEIDKLVGVEENAEVNNISDANATDLTAEGDSSLHYHSSDRDRTNHTGTQAYTTISGFSFVNLSDTTLTAPTAGDTLIIDSDNSTVRNVGTEEFDYIIKNKSLNITDDYQLLFDLLQNYKIDFILVENNTANAMVLNVGSTTGGNDIVSAKSIPASDLVLIEGSEILKSFFSLTSDTELYVSDNVAGWNSASINIYFSFQKVSE